MRQAQKLDRRVVSRGEYIKAQRQRIATFVLASVLWMATAAGTAYLGLCMFQAIAGCLESDAMVIAFLPLFFIVFIVGGLITLLFGSAAKHATQKIRAMPPLPCADTSHLLLPDTLVRASQEPTQAQQTILLRAAAETQDRHEEQLLRATSGEKENA